jgi:hypothetical protein
MIGGCIPGDGSDFEIIDMRAYDTENMSKYQKGFFG